MDIPSPGFFPRAELTALSLAGLNRIANYTYKDDEGSNERCSDHQAIPVIFG